MSLHETDSGTRVTLANLTNVTDPVVAPDPYLLVTEDLIERSEFAGGKDATTATADDQTSKAFLAGQVVRTSEIVAKLTAASVTSITPASGPVGGTTALTIKGKGLDGVTAVSIGGVAATSVVSVDPRTVTCVAPAHAAGAVNVVVTDDSGQVTVTNGYTYA